MEGWGVSEKGRAGERRGSSQRETYCLKQWFLKCGPQTSALASSECFLEIQILGPLLRLTDSETLG